MMYDDLPIKSGDFPVCYIKQPEGIYLFSVPNVTEVSQGLAEKRRQRARRFVQDASLGSFTSGGISLGGKGYRKMHVLFIRINVYYIYIYLCIIYIYMHIIYSYNSNIALIMIVPISHDFL